LTEKGISIQWIPLYLGNIIKILNIDYMDKVENLEIVFSFIKEHFYNIFIEFFKIHNEFFPQFLKYLDLYLDEIKGSINPTNDEEINVINFDLESFEDIFKEFNLSTPRLEISDEDIEEYYGNMAEPDEDAFRDAQYMDGSKTEEPDNIDDIFDEFRTK
jgi:hypothetical protein